MNPKHHTSPTAVPFLPDDVARLGVYSHEAIRARRAARGTPAWGDENTRAVRRVIKAYLRQYDGLHRGLDYAVPVREVLAALNREHSRGLTSAPGVVVLANALNTDAVEVVTQRSHLEKRRVS